MLKVFLNCLILGITVSVIAENVNLVKNGDFLKLKKDGMPHSWQCKDYGTNATFKIASTENKNSIVIKLSSSKDMAYLRQPINKKVQQGSLIQLSCRYRTSDEYQTNKPLALFLELARPRGINGELSNRLYLQASPKWKDVEKTYITSRSEERSVCGFFAVKAKGKVLIGEIEVKEIAQSGKLNPDKQYIWREAEECLRSRKASVSKWNPEKKIKYSGKGAVGSAKTTLKWRFNVQDFIDTETLLPRAEEYHLWLRVYGYLNQPATKIVLSQKNRKTKVGAFKTVSTEQTNEKGEYAGPGNFYWQYAGPLKVTKGIYELQIEPSERFYCDALLLTNDINYKPEEFEARKVGIKTVSTFKTLRKDEKVFIDTSYLQFGVTDKFATPLNLQFSSKKGFKASRNINNPAYVYIALPNWIKIVSLTSHWAGRDWKTSASAGNLQIEQLGKREIKGKEYQLYRTPVYYITSRFIFYIQASSNVNDGLKENTFFWVEDGKYKSSKKSCLLEMVKLKENIPAFKNIFIGPMGMHMRSFFRDYPGLPEALKHCGINMVNIFGGESMVRNKNSSITKQFVNDCTKRGISVIDEISPGFKYFSAKPVYARRIDGKKHNRELALHMNEKTPYMQCFLEAINNIVKGGCSGLSLDDEVFNHASDTIDFSQKTVVLFKEYLEEKYSDLTYVDPITIVKNKDDYRKLYQAWIDFRCTRVMSWYKLYRSVYDSAMMQYGTNSTFGKKYFIPVIVNAKPELFKQQILMDIPRLAQYATHISPMIYTYHGIKDSGIVGSSIKRLKNLTGLEKNIITPTLLGGHRGQGEIPSDQIKMVKYEIYECLINQSPGMFFWVTSGFMNPLVLREVRIALKTMVPYEGFFTKGTPVYVKLSPVALNIDALKLGNKILVYVSNYNLAKNIVAAIELPKGNIKKVIDLETGNSLFFSKNQFKVDFSKEQGRMFLVELQ